MPAAYGLYSLLTAYGLLLTATYLLLAMLEVMPWGMWDYPRTYTGLLKGSGVLHERLLSLRPPTEAAQFVSNTTGAQELDQVSGESSVEP